MNTAACAELARVFLWMGTFSFGGPAAHTALMERELVERRRWLSREQFLDLVGLTQLIPGPNSTELAMCIGQLRAGTPGLLVAGACFILPAALMVGALAALYYRFHALPLLLGPFDALKPVVVAIVADALLRVAPTAARSPLLAVLLGAAASASLLGVHELLVVVLGGLVASALRLPSPPGSSPSSSPPRPSPEIPERGAEDGEVAPRLSSPPGASASSSPPRPSPEIPERGAGGGEVAGTGTLVPAFVPLLTAGAGAGATTAPTLLGLLGFFLKVGSVLYGSGYVLLAFLRSGLVEELKWLTETQLLDAVAVGQITPGPVFTTATFIGYLIGNWPGAIAATVGIFAPSFVFVAFGGGLIDRLLRWPRFRPFLDGVNAASLGLMLAVDLRLGAAVATGPLPLAIGAIAFVALARFRINAAWVMLAAAALGAVR